MKFKTLKISTFTKKRDHICCENILILIYFIYFYIIFINLSLTLFRSDLRSEGTFDKDELARCSLLQVA